MFTSCAWQINVQSSRICSLGCVLYGMFCIVCYKWMGNFRGVNILRWKLVFTPLEHWPARYSSSIVVSLWRVLCGMFCIVFCKWMAESRGIDILRLAVTWTPLEHWQTQRSSTHNHLSLMCPPRYDLHCFLQVNGQVEINHLSAVCVLISTVRTPSLRVSTSNRLELFANLVCAWEAQLRLRKVLCKVKFICWQLPRHVSLGGLANFWH